MLASAKDPARLSPGEELRRDVAWYEEALRAPLLPARHVEVLLSQARGYRKLGQEETAIQLVERALGICPRAGIDEQKADALVVLGACKLQLNRHAEAGEHLEAALPIFLKAKNRRGEANVLNMLAGIDARRGEEKRAAERLERAVLLFREIKDQEGETNAAGNHGILYMEEGRHEEAKKALTTAIANARAANNDFGEAIFVYTLAEAHQKLGEWEAGVKCWNRALELAKHTGQRHVEDEALNALGVLLDGLGRSEESARIFEQVLVQRRKAGDRLRTAYTLSNLAGSYRHMGRFHEALVHADAALVIYRELGAGIKEVAKALNVKGLIFADRGLLDSALEYLDEALRVARDEGDKKAETMVLFNLGTVWFQLQQPERSMGHFRDALQEMRDAKDRHGEALTLAALGSVTVEQGNRKGAIDLFEQALAIYRRQGNRREEGVVLGNLSSALLQEGETEKAAAAGKQALALDLETRNRRSECFVRGVLANVAENQGRFEEAIAGYEQALALQRELGMHRWEWMLWRLGPLDEHLGRREAALERYRFAHRTEMDSLSRLERSLDADGLGSTAESQAFRARGRYLDALLAAVSAAESPGEKQRLIFEALEVLESHRTRAFAQCMRASEMRDLLSEKGRQTWDRIAILREALAAEPVLSAPRKTPDPLEEEIASLERELKATEPKFAAVLAPRQALDAPALSSVLGPGEFLLHYTVLPEKTILLFEESGSGLSSRVIERSARDLVQDVERILAGITSPGAGGRPAPLPDLKRDLKDLAALLLPGLESELLGAKAVLVVADGPLQLLPFEALVLSGGEHLVEKLAIRYAPSLRVLLELAGKQPRRADVDLVAYGNPDFGDPEALDRDRKRGPRLRGSAAFRALPHAQKEIDAIGRLFANKLVRSGAEADESRFKAEAGRGRLLHVATHGTFAGGPAGARGALYASGLAFAGCNGAPSGKEDGFLSAAEVLVLDLRKVELAVLSACDSAKGDVGSVEGKVGLERAFFASGASAVLGSLWEVEDDATARFMERFHTLARDGRDASRALRAVKLEFLGKPPPARDRAAGDKRGLSGLQPAAQRGASLAHPYYWAPFVLSGRPHLAASQ
jgi:CHAT domain-containing protein/tetratricopeptide (TPR) repeat protein